ATSSTLLASWVRSKHPISALSPLASSCQSAWPCCSLPTLFVLTRLRPQISRCVSPLVTSVRPRFHATRLLLCLVQLDKLSTTLPELFSISAAASLSRRLLSASASHLRPPGSSCLSPPSRCAFQVL